MRLLLDTHIVLWALTDDRRLGALARKLIADPANEVYVSAATIWELAIKHALRRTSLPVSGTAVIDYCTQARYQFLDVRPLHAAAVETLPALHGDPFDRMLIAQALTEPMRLITHDRTLAAYTDTVILA